jgi:hypothetical protein
MEVKEFQVAQQLCFHQREANRLVTGAQRDLHQRLSDLLGVRASIVSALS